MMTGGIGGTVLAGAIPFVTALSARILPVTDGPAGTVFTAILMEGIVPGAGGSPVVAPVGAIPFATALAVRILPVMDGLAGTAFTAILTEGIVPRAGGSPVVAPVLVGKEGVGNSASGSWSSVAGMAPAVWNGYRVGFASSLLSDNMEWVP